MVVEHNPDTCAGRVLRVSQSQEFDELHAPMPFAYQAQNFAGQQVDPG
jgi:hypothetical protein